MLGPTGRAAVRWQTERLVRQARECLGAPQLAEQSTQWRHDAALLAAAVEAAVRAQLTHLSVPDNSWALPDADPIADIRALVRAEYGDIIRQTGSYGPFERWFRDENGELLPLPEAQARAEKLSAVALEDSDAAWDEIDRVQHEAMGALDKLLDKLEESE